MLFLISGVLVIIIITLIKNKLSEWHHKVKGPTPWPIIGNSWRFFGDSVNFLKQLNELHEEYGPRFKIILGPKLFYVMKDPSDMEKILSSSEMITKAEVYKYLRSWLGDGLLLSTGTKWKLHRKFLTPAFHYNILKTFLATFVNNDKILINKLKQYANGKPFDVFPLAALTALDNIAQSSMGVNINALNDEESRYVKAIKSVSEICSLRMFNILYFNDKIFNLTSLGKQHSDGIKLLHEYTDDVIIKRREQLSDNKITIDEYNEDIGLKNKYCFLDLLLLSEMESGGKLNLEAIRDEVNTFMFEGHDTTASAISFCLYCLSRNEHVQENVYEEQKRIFGNDLSREHTFNDVMEMKYLELVIKETLRLYPSVPLISRNMEKNVDFGNFSIPKGTMTTLNFFAMHRDPLHFEDPLEFRPERFEKKDLRHNFSWLAFSAGPRNCIGQKYALLELKSTIASIVRNYIIKPANIDLVLASDLILRSKSGIHIKLLPRK